MPFAGGSVYSMTKAALVGLVKGLARDLGPRGITVKQRAAGTDRHRHEPRHRRLRRLAAEPDGPAPLRHHRRDHLAGPEAGFVTGASLTIDEGFTT